MKFKYGDRVKVINGFFEDLRGYTVDFDEESNTYHCELSGVRCNQHTSTVAWVKEEDLELLYRGRKEFE